MSPKLPAIRPAALVSALERDGWARRSQKGSHLKLRKEGYPRIIVPMHNRDVPQGTLKAILGDAGISEDRFLELLRT